MSVESINNKIDLVIGYKADIKTALQEQDSSISDSTLLAEYADKIRAMTLVEGDAATEITELRNQVTTLQTQVNNLEEENALLSERLAIAEQKTNSILGVEA